MRRKPLNVRQRTTYHSVEDVIGCKWSAAIVGALSHGVRRPGELERYIPGISTKVLNERLRRLLEYRLISREAGEGFPLRVEYELTEPGRRVAALVQELQELNRALDAKATATGDRRD